MVNSKYIIISPVRNEGQHVEKTIISVLSQTLKPLKWIIVDDGSSDKTREIIQKYAQSNDLITLISLPDRGYYDLMQGGEIKAFYKGYEVIQNGEYNFLVKLDGDISFNETYFEDLILEFEKNPKLGIASGDCYHYEGDRLVREKSYKLHVRGAARAYRKRCWDDIGGVIRELGWDAIDVYKARMMGWETYSFERIKMIHHVKTWAKGGLIHGKERSGRMYYLMGTHPMFFIARIFKEAAEKPYIIGACAILYGYLKSMLQRENRVVSAQLMNFIRDDQLSRLIRMKQKNKKLEVDGIAFSKKNISN
jgi:biofilm PGA synthesis N-glycosyltransferase PgaC